MNELANRQRTTGAVKVWQRLLWKDAWTLRPLALAIGVVLVLGYALVVLLTDNSRELKQVSAVLWFFLPNLMALGAPALLIGTEEENGTLRWLRTLPVSWQAIASSKLLVASGALLVAWLASSLALWLAVALSQGPMLSATAIGNPTFDELLSLSGIAQMLFFSGVLLLCGFATAYLFRSPVTALLVVAPTVAVVMLFCNEVGQPLLQAWTATGSLFRDVAYVVAATAVLVALWYAQHLIARRRLCAPEASLLDRFSEALPHDAYRPPVAASLSRPSPTRALLWQQWRQVATLGMGLYLLAAASLGFILWEHNLRLRNDWANGFNALAHLAINAAVIWLGALTFYGDSVRRRCDYFADRGVSPSAVWWTRVLPTFALVLLLLPLIVLVDWLSGSRNSPLAAAWCAGILALYATGQLASQWSARPTLAFFAAPMIAALGSLSLIWIFSVYSGFLPTLLLTVPVLLFATWRLSGRWLRGDLNFGYHWRAAAYVALAVALPLLFIFASRWVTAPEKLTQWRQKMFAANLSLDSVATDTLPSPLPAAYAKWHHLDEHWSPTIDDDLQQELGGEEPLGSYVSFQQLANVLAVAAGRARISDVDEVSVDHLSNPTQWISPPGDETTRIRQRQAIEILLNWSSDVRRAVVAHRLTAEALVGIAEPAEALAIGELVSMQQRQGPSGELAALVAKFPDPQLRRQSRRAAFIREWQDYATTPWPDEESHHFKTFAGNGILQPEVAQFAIERWRSDRWIDHVTRELLEQIESEQFFRDPDELQRWVEQWDQAQWGPQADNWANDTHPSSLSAIVRQMRLADEQLQQLREAN